MTTASQLALAFIAVPFIAAFVVYALTHFQLLLMNKLLHFDVPHATRTKINISAFIISFVLTLGLVIAKRYFEG